MKKIGYTLATLTTLAVLAIFFLRLDYQSSFPPIDSSTEYDYCVIDGSVYLELVRHNVYIIITQYGIMHGENPDLVKRDEGHNKVYDLLSSDFKSVQESDEALARYNAWEDEYNINPGNRIDLEDAELRVRIPQNKNPYEWKPDEKAQSFREYYEEAEENTFRKSIFYDTKYYL